MDELQQIEKQEKELEKILNKRREVCYTYIGKQISSAYKAIAVSVTMFVLGGVDVVLFTSEEVPVWCLILGGLIALVGGIMCYSAIFQELPKRKKQQSMVSVELEKIEDEIAKEKDMYEKIAKQQEEFKKQQEALKKKQWEYDHPVCPVCGGRNTKRITTANRAVSVAAVGLASGKIGKQYQCLSCKHMW